MMREEMEEYLKQVTGWKLIGEALEKNFKFANFRQAIEFVNRVADAAEAQNHHPDILVWNWNNVRITTTTHAVKGLSKNDFLLASKIDEIRLK